MLPLQFPQTDQEEHDQVFGVKKVSNFISDGAGNLVRQLGDSTGAITLSNPIQITVNGGLTKINATETPDGTIVNFTFAQKPTYIVSDGAWYRENFGWTWSGTQAVMSVPPQFDIFGFI